MTAMYWVDDETPEGHPLAKGASPAAIRAVLTGEDRTEFDAAYAEALDGARTSGDLAELFTTLEHWRRIAALRSDPQLFANVARRAAFLITGHTAPEDQPPGEAQAQHRP